MPAFNVKFLCSVYSDHKGMESAVVLLCNWPFFVTPREVDSLLVVSVITYFRY